MNDFEKELTIKYLSKIKKDEHELLKELFKIFMFASENEDFTNKEKILDMFLKNVNMDVLIGFKIIGRMY